MSSVGWDSAGEVTADIRFVLRVLTYDMDPTFCVAKINLEAVDVDVAAKVDDEVVVGAVVVVTMVVDVVAEVIVEVAVEVVVEVAVEVVEEVAVDVVVPSAGIR